MLNFRETLINKKQGAAMGSFEEILVKKHLKRTKARVMILKVLEKSLPLTAGEVYEAVRGKDMRLSLSTVYRN